MTACPGCEQDTPLAAHGVLAPFVAELMGLPLGLRVGYRECASCGLGFFDYRYTQSQIERLYDGYRGADYFRIRRSWEPWYRADVNDAYAPGSPAVEDRVRFASEILVRGGLKGPLECAVDFGGDQGQFFPDVVPIKRRVVVELSGQPLLPGVERVPSLESLSERPDLVVVAHVLEHLGDPRALLTEIHRTLDSSGLLYVEVPLERPRVRGWHRSRPYAGWVRGVTGRRWSFIPVDFASGVSRQLGWKIPRLGVVKESEHINFFTPASLASLLEACGFEITAERSEPNARTGALRLGRLGMSAVPRAR